MKAGVNTLAFYVGIVRACWVLRVHRSSFYREDVLRRCLIAPAVIRQRRPAPPLALRGPQRQALHDVLCGEHFANCAPPTTYATRCLMRETTRRRCAPSTDFSQPTTRHKSDLIRAPILSTPSPSCWRPGQTRFGSGISQRSMAVKWTCYHLYVILDIFSR